MGAASSIKQLYSESHVWFKNYIDMETYLADFKSFDKDGGGSISFVEFQKRIEERAAGNTDDAKFWAMLLNSGPVIRVAHRHASVQNGRVTNREAVQCVDVSEFKALLIHMFVGSVLWRFFEFADNAFDENAGDKQLSFQEFRIAVRAFCKAHAQEELDDEAIRADFDLLDSNMTNTIGFLTLIKYTSQFIDPSFDISSPFPTKEKLLSRKVSAKEKVVKILGTTQAMEQVEKNTVTELMDDLNQGNKFYKLLTPEEKSREAIMQLTRVLDNNDSIMQEEKKLLVGMSENGGQNVSTTTAADATAVLDEQTATSGSGKIKTLSPSGKRRGSIVQPTATHMGIPA